MFAYSFGRSVGRSVGRSLTGLNRELFIANALSRHFAWSQNIMFVEDFLSNSSKGTREFSFAENSTEYKESENSNRQLCCFDETTIDHTVSKERGVLLPSIYHQVQKVCFFSIALVYISVFVGRV